MSAFLIHVSADKIWMLSDSMAFRDCEPIYEPMKKVFTPNATIFSPRTRGVLDRLVDSQDQPLQSPMSFNNLLKLPTSQVPNELVHGSAENASVAFVGDFSKLMIGVRTNLVMEVTRVGSDSDSSAFENLQIWWRAYLRADIQLMHPNHFCLIQGIIPAAS